MSVNITDNRSPVQVKKNTYRGMNTLCKSQSRLQADQHVTENTTAVIVRDRTILSTGYNGSIRGMPHCDDVGHMMENGHCIATVHAKQCYYSGSQKRYCYCRAGLCDRRAEPL